MTRPLLLLSALTLSLAACETEISGPECNRIELTRTGTRGDTVVLNTGLRYIELRAGSGEAVEYCDLVRVGYEGRFLSGEVFDPGSVPLDRYLGYGQLIVGFEQGLIGMQKGGQRRIIIPPSLGYGTQDLTDRFGTVVIPRNSTLVFDVEVIEHAPVER